MLYKLVKPARHLGEGYTDCTVRHIRDNVWETPFPVFNAIYVTDEDVIADKRFYRHVGAVNAVRVTKVGLTAALKDLEESSEGHIVYLNYGMWSQDPVDIDKVRIRYAEIPATIEYGEADGSEYKDSEEEEAAPKEEAC